VNTNFLFVLILMANKEGWVGATGLVSDRYPTSKIHINLQNNVGRAVILSYSYKTQNDETTTIL